MGAKNIAQDGKTYVLIHLFLLFFYLNSGDIKQLYHRTFTAKQYFDEPNNRTLKALLCLN